MIARTLCIVLALAAMPAALQAQTQTRLAPDLIRDRPSSLERAWSTASDMAVDALRWTGFVLGIVPPRIDPLPPAQGEAADLFALLAIAGYQVKEIHQEIGVSPKTTYSLTLGFDMSGADLDFLDEQLELSETLSPGLLGRLERAIVTSVVAINTGGGMRVSEIKVTLLPLPKAEFSITPTEKAARGEEDDVYARALQLVDRRVRDLAETRLRR
ncbi:MAG: hypothetical protein AB7P02_20460 [Alphaproteobacteria bacterium]